MVTPSASSRPKWLRLRKRDGEAVDEDERHKAPSSTSPPTRPNSSASMVKMKSVCFSGRKLEMRLGALHEALAEEPAGADRDLRLQAVIAGAQRIVLRDRGRCRCGSSDSRAGSARRPAPMRRRAAMHQREFPQPHPGEKEHRAAAQDQHHRGAEIGLLQHQRRRHEHEQHGRISRTGRPISSGESALK